MTSSSAVRPVASSCRPPTASLADAAACLQRAQAAVAAGAVDDALELVGRLEPLPLGPAESTAAGLVHVIAGAPAAALAWFDRALATAPDFPLALAHRAGALHRLGRLEAAAAAFAEARAVAGEDGGLAYDHGLVLRALGRREAAIAAFDAVLRLQPAHAGALLAGGEILQDAQNLDAALAFYEAAAKADPSLTKAWFAIGVLRQARGDLTAALAAFDAVLARAAGHPDALCNKAVLLLHLGRLDAAEAACDAALAARPGFAEALSNRGCIAMRRLRFAAALADFDAALTRKPDHLEALSNRALTLQELGRLDDAERAFATALHHHPAAAAVRKNQAMLRLLRGDLFRGFAGYEARWAAGQGRIFVAVDLPVWPGPAAGFGRLLVLDEQGFGDAIMLVRFLPLLVAQGAQVTFACRENLCALLGPALPGVRVVSGPPAEPFDHQIALASLPFALGQTPATIPAPASYLTADPARAALWAGRIGTRGLRVGLCWQGNAANAPQLARSLPLACFAPLAQVPGVRLVSLQQRDGLEQIAALGDPAWLERPPGEVDAGADAFVDTAALMMSLDLVVTCDTAIAHLAGALGRPVWTLLKTNPDWRWQLERTDSPWYPSMRLFRQARVGDWGGVMDDVVAALRARVAPTEPV